MKNDVVAPTYMITGAEPELWYRDPISCLQATFASMLARAGADPLAVLGAAWRFVHLPGDVRSEEFYYPCPTDDGGAADLGAALAPHHALHARWWQPADRQDPLGEVREALSQDRWVIAAVDNFHLPFRPAYHDVHAAHLVIVYGLDEAGGLIYVQDSMPPAFCGSIPIEAFLRSWGSANPEDVQDAFFSDSRIDQRCLSVWLDAAPAPLTPDLLGQYLRADGDFFVAPADPDSPMRSGLAGFEAFRAELIDRCQINDATVLRELYAFGWGMQAQASLHGELLRRCGRDWGEPELAGAGRRVEAVAHAWTGLRITGAHGRENARAVVSDIRRHATVLRSKYTEAVEALGDVAARL